jgi:hypothetical protein
LLLNQSPASKNRAHFGKQQALSRSVKKNSPNPSKQKSPPSQINLTRPPGSENPSIGSTASLTRTAINPPRRHSVLLPKLRSVSSTPHPCLSAEHTLGIPTAQNQQKLSHPDSRTHPGCLEEARPSRCCSNLQPFKPFTFAILVEL